MQRSYNMMSSAGEEIDRLVEAASFEAARRRLAALWREDMSPSAANFVVPRYEAIADHLSIPSWRIAILRSFTVEPVVPLLKAAAFADGLQVTIQVGDFNAFAQELLDQQSALYQFQPDLVVLATELRALAPELWDGAAASPGAARRAASVRLLRDIEAWLHAFRTRSAAHIVVHNFEVPAVPAQGVLDHQCPDGQYAVVRELNAELTQMARRLRGVYILDYDGLMARHGREAWRDERKWLTVRLPIAAPHLLDLAREWLRFVYPLAGRVAKALVVDLDNTLWGGMIGEDGLAGIRLGPEYPGAAFQALQRAMLDLWHRGILLAVCSKNNPDEALEALETHPGMLLKRSHFSSLRINWDDKAVNLREIAAELNLGIDALAFLDDNPVEREHVRDAAPEVYVLDPPSDAMGYARAVRDCPLFERLTVSAEDRQRGQYYATARDRAALRQSAQSKEAFYRSLEQEVEIDDVSPLTLARAAQLTQKTNQFNLTTRRYSDQEIAKMIAGGARRVRTIRVRDRHGDNGLVGVAITGEVGDACEIDTFLLSCRVIGRTVETALLAAIVEDARRRGRSRVRGWFLPTAKNAPASGFYERHGFQAVAQTEEAAVWELDLQMDDVKFPEWIRVLTPVRRDPS